MVRGPAGGRVRLDTLVGRQVIYGKYHYDLTCTAVVVKSPSHVENNTKECK